MPLAALICAYQDDEEGGLRALLPLAGRTLLERQVRLASSVGAHPLLVVVERLPPQLVTALDQLRAEGLHILLARTAEEAAAAVDPRQRLLLVADGLIADRDLYAAVASSEPVTVLTVPDQGADERFERIDASSRWAGLAVIEGSLLKSTAAELYDWDLQSTLLRRALQLGARSLPAATAGGASELTIATGAADLVDAEHRMMAAAVRPQEDWASRYVLAPVEYAATHALAPTDLAADWLRLGAVALTGLAALLFGLDWRWAGGALMLLATPLDGIAARLSALRLQIREPGAWDSWSLPAASALALLALGHSTARTSGWGCTLLAAVTIAFLLAARGEGGGRGLRARAWLAERKGMVLAFVPFALAGRWDFGLGALAAYAAGSFFWLQRQVHAGAVAKGQD